MNVLDMEGRAAIYSRDARSAIKNGQWQEACYLLLERCRKLDMALQSLTPGGSEYVGDPDRCVAYAKEQIDKGRKARLTMASNQRTAHDIEARDGDQNQR